MSDYVLFEGTLDEVEEWLIGLETPDLVTTRVRVVAAPTDEQPWAAGSTPTRAQFDRAVLAKVDDVASCLASLDQRAADPAPTDPGEWSAEDRDRWLRWRAAHPQDDEDATDPARLWCARCDRAVTPDEIEEGNPTGSMPWWFHTCGDAVGLRGRRPQGTDFRSYVTSLLADPALTNYVADRHVERCESPECPCYWDGRHARPRPPPPTRSVR